MEPTPAPTASSQLIIDSPHELARWRPLVQWILYIPHGVVAYVFNAVSGVVALIYWFIVLFTGRPNKGLYEFSVMMLRYETRANLFLIGYSEQFPPFAFSQGASDDGAYPPVRIELPEPPETVSRKALFNIVLALPHYVMFAVYGIAAVVVLVIAWFAVIFTGSWPVGMRDFITRYSAYFLRVWAYVFMVDNDYPSFSLK